MLGNMPGVIINLEGDKAFEEEQKTYGDSFVFLEKPLLKLARLPNGTASGASVAFIGFEFEGKYIVAQTTLRLLKNAVRAMEVRDEMEKRPT